MPYRPQQLLCVPWAAAVRNWFGLGGAALDRACLSCCRARARVPTNESFDRIDECKRETSRSALLPSIMLYRREKSGNQQKKMLVSAFPEYHIHPPRIRRFTGIRVLVWELVSKSERHGIPILEYASFPDSGHPAPGPSRPSRGFWLDSFCLGVHPTRSLSQYR